MATLEQLEQALRAADAAGNVEDAQALAQEYARVRAASRPAVVEAPASPIDGMSRAQQYVAGLGKSFVDSAHGGRQFLTEMVAQPFSAVGNIYGAMGEQRAQQGLNAPAREAARLRAEETERQKLDAPLMQTGAGLAGNVTGTAAQLVLPGIAGRGSPMLRSALMPRSVVGNALQGSALGMIQPVGTDDSRTQNAILGGAAGGAGAAIPALAGATYRTGKSILQPLTKAGQESIVAQLLQRSAVNPGRLAQEAPSSIPGVVRTLAEESADPGIAQLQRQFSTQLSDQTIANNAARTAAVRDAFEGADDAGISTIRAARDQQADSVLAGLPAQAAPDMRPVRQAIESAIESKRGFSAAQVALREVLDEMPVDIRNAEEAYNVRKQIDFILSKQSNKPAAKAATRELQQAKAVLDREMTKVFPEWGDYLFNYTAQSRRIDQAKVGKALLGMARQATDPNTSERSLGANALSRAANDPDALVRGATRFNKSTAGSTLTPEQSQLLRMLGDDAARMDFASTAGRAVGSDTAQNLATRNIMSQLAGSSRAGRFLAGSQPAQRIAALGEKTYGLFGVPERLQEVTLEALSNPARARQILERLPKADRSLLHDALVQMGGRAGALAIPAID